MIRFDFIGELVSAARKLAEYSVYAVFLSIPVVPVDSAAFDRYNKQFGFGKGRLV